MSGSISSHEVNSFVYRSSGNGGKTVRDKGRRPYACKLCIERIMND